MCEFQTGGKWVPTSSPTRAAPLRGNSTPSGIFKALREKDSYKVQGKKRKERKKKRGLGSGDMEPTEVWAGKTKILKEIAPLTLFSCACDKIDAIFP